MQLILAFSWWSTLCVVRLIGRGGGCVARCIAARASRIRFHYDALTVCVCVCRSDRRSSRPISFVACDRAVPFSRASTWYSRRGILVPHPRGTLGRSEDLGLRIVRGGGLECQLHAGLCITPFHFTLGLLQHRGLGRDRVTGGAQRSN